jgi:hypothetical protein
MPACFHGLAGVELRARAGVDGKDQRQVPADLRQRLQDAFQRGRVVHVGRAVQRDDAIGARRQAEPCGHAHGARLHEVAAERIDHQIAHQMDPLRVGAFAPEIGDAARLADQQQVRDGIREDAVDLLGHGAVEAAQARFDVNDGNAQLGGDKRASERGVDVADNEDGVRVRVEGHRLEAPEDFRGLPGVRSRADAEIEVRVGKTEVAEERARHLMVVMLAGVDQQGVETAVGAQRFKQRSELHEIRPRPADAENSQGTPPPAHERISCFLPVCHAGRLRSQRASGPQRRSARTAAALAAPAHAKKRPATRDGGPRRRLPRQEPISSESG